MADSFEVSIPTTTTSTTLKPYTIYNITVRQPLRSYTLQKRYSDFVTLNDDLTSQTSNSAPPLPLPGKSWFKKTVSNPDLREDRRHGLETYIQTIIACPDSRWRRTNAFVRFLNLPTSAAKGNTKSPSSNGSVPAASMHHSDLHPASIMDSSVWLDIYRDLTSQLRETQAALRRRTDASTAQAQHEAAAEVKRNLVRSDTTITALDDGLRQISEAAKAPRRAKGGEKAAEAPRSHLSENEITRRRGLLGAARKERNSLEAQLTAVTTKSSSASFETAAVPAQKDALLSGKASSSASHTANKPSGSRRVLGAPAQETERTRELDNEGVLQLQQQIMEEQDEDVTDLTKTVARMKAMGVQINEELAYQNGMLKILDQDVDRNADKIAVAKGRVGKIK